MRAKLKPDYRYKTATLMGGVEFNKTEWVFVPRMKEDEARQSGILLIEGETPEQTAANAAGPNNPAPAIPEPSFVQAVQSDVGHQPLQEMLDQSIQEKAEKTEELEEEREDEAKPATRRTTSATSKKK